MHQVHRKASIEKEVCTAHFSLSVQPHSDKHLIAAHIEALNPKHCNLNSDRQDINNKTANFFLHVVIHPFLVTCLVTDLDFSLVRPVGQLGFALASQQGPRCYPGLGGVF